MIPEIDDREEVKFDIMSNPEGFGYGLRIYTRNVNTDAITMVKMLEFEPHERGAIAKPCVAMSRDALQGLCDGLYRAGFKPTDLQSGSEVEQAKDDHLKDLRTALTEVSAIRSEEHSLLVETTRAILKRNMAVIAINEDRTLIEDAIDE